ncbi:MAG: ribosomal protein S18-alanine N-acetyltransferase [Desulfobacteraceae bacterium]|nr:ribosomal protein S18-alanine N-acetyltransferase [Desulfobacteraceae bacterium]
MISLQEVTTENFQRFRDDILAVERVSFPSPWSLKAFEEEAKRSISNLWVLLEDGELGGYICLWIFGGEVHLMNIAVHPDKRRRGFGGCLLNKMIEVGLSQGITRAWLEVRPSNVIARAFYKKVGFSEIGRRPHYYKETNEDAIIMTLSLMPEDVGSWEADDDIRVRQVA